MLISQVHFNPTILVDEDIKQVKHHGIYTLVMHTSKTVFRKPCITLDYRQYPFCFTPCMINFVEELKRSNKLQ